RGETVGMKLQNFGLSVNGRRREVSASGETPLVYLLRNDLGLKGTRFGCGEGNCGACMVLIGGRAEKSCQTPVESVGEREIETVEGLAEGELSPVQRAMLDGQAGQCGYCLSGVIVAATALLRTQPAPS